MDNLLTYDLSPETLAKAAALRSCFVQTPRMNRIVQVTRLLHATVPAIRQSGRPGGHADCKLVVGLPGSGKTTAVKYYSDQYLPIEEEEHTLHRVLYVQVPPEATLRAFAQTLYYAIQNQGHGRGAQADITLRFLSLAKDTGLELLIIDEAQNLGRLDDRRNPNATASWVRGLLDAKRFNILLVGLPEAATIFTRKLDLVRRGGGVITMEPYDWNDEKDRQTFRMFLQRFDQTTGHAELSGLADERMALRFYNFSGGLVGLAVRILEEANDVSWVTGMKKVTLDLLASIAESYRPKGQAGWVNPFRARTLEPTRPGIASVSLDLADPDDQLTRLRGNLNRVARMQAV